MLPENIHVSPYSVRLKPVSHGKPKHPQPDFSCFHTLTLLFVFVIGLCLVDAFLWYRSEQKGEDPIIYLVRHGEDEDGSNTIDAELSAVGQFQASSLFERKRELFQQEGGLIFFSPLRRALQTCLRATNNGKDEPNPKHDYFVTSELAGRGTGSEPQELQKRFPIILGDLKEHWWEQPFEHTDLRVESFLADLASNLFLKKRPFIVIFAHKSPLKYLQSFLEGTKPEDHHDFRHCEMRLVKWSTFQKYKMKGKPQQASGVRVGDTH